MSDSLLITGASHGFGKDAAPTLAAAEHRACATMRDVNVFGIQRVPRAAPSAMREVGSGMVINIDSILGRVTIALFGLHGATKHAIQAQLIRGIHVVPLQPGPYPANLYSMHLKPADSGREAEYGQVVGDRISASDGIALAESIEAKLTSGIGMDGPAMLKVRGEACWTTRLDARRSNEYRGVQ